MFREMRRKKQQLSEAECVRILQAGTSGVLAVLGDGGYPYAVPLSYVWAGGKIWFHCARSGHKLDAVRACDKASFCVIGQDRIVPEKYTTWFRSVIAFGRVRELTGEERQHAIAVLADKYHPTALPADRDRAIAQDGQTMCVLELAVEHMTGKEATELVRQRERSGEN